MKKEVKRFNQSLVDYMLMMFRQYQDHQREYLKPLVEQIVPETERERQIAWENYASGHHRASGELRRLFESCLIEENDKAEAENNTTYLDTV